MKITVITTGCVDYEGRLYFKGDTIDLPDKVAKHLLNKRVCEMHSYASFAEKQDQYDSIIARNSKLNDMAVAELKKLLDKLKISYSAKLKKDDLIALVVTNTKDCED